MAAPENKGGRPSKYTPDLADEICARIAGGEALRGICAEPEMPTVSTVLLWVVQDREGFSEHYMRAQDAKGSYDADRTQEVYEAVERGDIDASQARVMFDILRWSAERRAPKRYGSKQQIEHSGGVTVDDSVSDEERAERIAAILERARNRRAGSANEE